jgi:hypothetical protein
VSAKACTHRVERDVADRLREVLVRLDDARGESLLKEVADEPEPFVEVPGVLAVQSLHALRQIWLWSFYEQVKVIRHEAEGVLSPAVATNDPVAQDEESPTVVIVLEDRLPAVPTRGHVVDAAGDQDSWRAWHEPRLRTSRSA